MKSFYKKEWVFVIILSLALGLRQMTMTMIMPFISVYSMSLKGSTPFLTGVALGIYGLMQAIFQIPYGLLGDRFGNKKMMLIGIVQVMCGLFLGYMAHNIYILILSRALQGSGAILAIGYSWLATETRREVRTSALSIMGMVIGVTATLSFVFGPLLYHVMSIEQMFLVGAILFGVIFIIILFGLSDEHVEKEVNIEQDGLTWQMLFKDRNFCLLNGLSFMNNYIITGAFLILPLIIATRVGLGQMWTVFTPGVLIALVYMKLITPYLDRAFTKIILLVNTLILLFGVVLLLFANSNTVLLYTGVILLMMGYISLATCVPTIVNNKVHDSNRGVVNGVINSLQYVGAFVGAIVSGVCMNYGMNVTIVALCCVCALFCASLFFYQE
ncbi:MAG: MFS transporter [Culicoidibacterales bacterium]